MYLTVSYLVSLLVLLPVTFHHQGQGKLKYHNKKTSKLQKEKVRPNHCLAENMIEHSNLT